MSHSSCNRDCSFLVAASHVLFYAHLRNVLYHVYHVVSQGFLTAMPALSSTERIPATCHQLKRPCASAADVLGCCVALLSIALPKCQVASRTRTALLGALWPQQLTVLGLGPTPHEQVVLGEGRVLRGRTTGTVGERERERDGFWRRREDSGAMLQWVSLDLDMFKVWSFVQAW